MRLLRCTLASLILMLITPFAPAAQAIKAERWDVIDLPFEMKSKRDAPFELDFTATFTGPAGATIEVPAFYNGGKQWIVRFSAPAAGQWKYRTHSSDKEFDNLKGSLKISENTDPNRHGGIVTREENPQHFFYEDGTPYMQLPFECDWLFAIDYDNPEATPKTDHLLDLLAKEGINQIVTTLYSYDVEWEKDPKLAAHPEHEYGSRDDIFPFLGSNPEPDFSSLNIDFFQKFDRVVEAMNERGISAHLMIYVWNKLVSWPGAETLEDNRYFDYIIKRYQAYPNIVWDVSKEALNNPRCSEEYGVERIQRIRKLDAYDRLVSVHDYGFCERNTEHVDFISIQTWSSTLYSDMLEIREKYPHLPIFNIEHGGYEASPYTVFPGSYDDTAHCLRRNYLIQFAGAYSTYYWQGAAWNAIIHNPFEQPADFGKPKFEWYGHLIDFFEKYPFHEYAPDPERNQSAYCLSNGKDTMLYYVPKENYQLSLYWQHPVAQPGGTIQWFNTLTGEYTKEVPSTSKYFFQSPFEGEVDSIMIRKFN